MKKLLYGLPKSVKRPKGAILIDGKHVADTLQCVHCSAHWVVVAGSGKHRGWCLRCKGPLCGSVRCMGDCIPLRKRLEGWEKKKPRRQLLKELDKEARSYMFSNGIYVK